MNFWDRLGRLHTKPVTNEDEYPTNNAYIYTAYYYILVQYMMKRMCELPEKMPFSRHPDQISSPISHDEITGVCILSKQHAKEICEHLKNHHNQFCDLPNFVAKPFYKLNPFKVYSAFKALSKEENPRKATVKYPDTHQIAFWQQPQYRWLYKRAAGLNPSLWEKAVFLVARGVSVFRWKMEEPNLLLYFSLKYLQQQDNLGIEGQLIQIYMNTYVNDMYKDEKDMLRYATRDLPAQYYNEHPFIKG